MCIDVGTVALSVHLLFECACTYPVVRRAWWKVCVWYVSANMSIQNVRFSIFWCCNPFHDPDFFSGYKAGGSTAGCSNLLVLLQTHWKCKLIETSEEHILTNLHVYYLLLQEIILGKTLQHYTKKGWRMSLEAVTWQD